MLRRYKALIVSAVAAATLATALPASAVDMGSVAIHPCRGTVGLVWEEWHQTVLVTGVFAPRNALDVQLTCGVVLYGETAGRVSEDVYGPVAVVAGSTRLFKGPITVCYEAVVRYVTHTDFLDTCP